MYLQFIVFYEKIEGYQVASLNKQREEMLTNPKPNKIVKEESEKFELNVKQHLVSPSNS